MEFAIISAQANVQVYLSDEHKEVKWLGHRVCMERCSPFVLLYICVFVCAQSCLTLCDPMDCSPPGSSAHGIFQARILEWVAIFFFRGSSQPRNQTCISWSSRQILYHWATWEAPKRGYNLLNPISSTGPVTIILPLTLHMVVNVSFSDYSPQMTVLTQKRPSGTKKLKAVR